MKKATGPGVHKYTVLPAPKNEDTCSVVGTTQKPVAPKFPQSLIFATS